MKNKEQIFDHMQKMLDFMDLPENSGEIQQVKLWAWYDALKWVITGGTDE